MASATTSSTASVATSTERSPCRRRSEGGVARRGLDTGDVVGTGNDTVYANRAARRNGLALLGQPESARFRGYRRPPVGAPGESERDGPQDDRKPIHPLHFTRNNASSAWPGSVQSEHDPGDGKVEEQASPVDERGDERRRYDGRVHPQAAQDQWQDGRHHGRLDDYEYGRHRDGRTDLQAHPERPGPHVGGQTHHSPQQRADRHLP